MKEYKTYTVRQNIRKVYVIRNLRLMLESFFFPWK